MRHGCKRTIEQPNCDQPSPQKTREKKHTRTKPTQTAFYFEGYKSNQLYHGFNVLVRERNMMMVCVLFLLPVLRLTLQAMNCVAVNDAIFSTDNLKQILFRIMPMMMITMGVRRGTIQTR